MRSQPDIEALHRWDRQHVWHAFTQMAEYDPRKYEWIGSLHQDTASCTVWKGAGQGIRTLDDLMKAKETVLFGSEFYRIDGRYDARFSGGGKLPGEVGFVWPAGEPGVGSRA